MRRYGSLAYGTTLYGLGTVETYASVSATFSTDIRQFTLVPVVHPYMDSAVIVSEDVRYLSTLKIALSDSIVFSEQVSVGLLNDARLADQVTFELDIRLKYVVTRMEDTIQFTLDTNISQFAEQFAFSTTVSYPIVIKSVFMIDNIEFDDNLFARFNWETVPDKPDNDWTPRPHDGDIWVPRESEDDAWLPRPYEGGAWAARTNTPDVWTPREQNNG